VIAPRVVLDTNVVVSALLFADGRLSWIRRAWQQGRIRPLICKKTTEELLGVPTYPKLKLNAAERGELLADFLPHAENGSAAEDETAPSRMQRSGRLDFSRARGHRWRVRVGHWRCRFAVPAGKSFADNSYCRRIEDPPARWHRTGPIAAQKARVGATFLSRIRPEKEHRRELWPPIWNEATPCGRRAVSATAAQPDARLPRAPDS